VEITEASSEETEQRLKNEQYRLVFPLKLKKSIKENHHELHATIRNERLRKR
jgi:hypothetical protein